MTHPRRAGIAVAIVVVLVLAATVWPTLYRPLAVDLSSWRGEPAPISARENRFTGDVQLLFVGRGWVAAYSETLQAMPGDSLHKLARRYHR